MKFTTSPRSGILNGNPKLNMASLSDRVSLNVPGPFYVDATCIDCDLCRALAPEIFGRDDDSGYSYVLRQPTTPEEIALATEAAQQCATESIGSDGG
jgi:ferredoxin